IYDLTDPAAPKLAGSTTLDGNIWMFMPGGDHVFALGNTYTPSGPYDHSLVDVQYIDVSNPAAPAALGSTQFGDGWAWSPAESTFKAFVVDSTKGLAVVPFSGWDYNSSQYTNGVQLVQFGGLGITGSGTARTKGWVERGIFVGNRLYSLSDQSMAVIDYSNPSAPKVIGETTLARNVVSAHPQGSTIAELSSDWYGNDITTSEMRVLPIGNASETTDTGNSVSTSIPGVDAQVFQNGSLAYVVTDVQVPVACDPTYGSPGPSGQCMGGTQQVTVVDTSNGGAVVRGSVQLPVMPYSYGYYYGDGWGWGGFWYYDWYDGANVTQVGGDALAFRRWFPQYKYDPATGYPEYVDSLDALFVVDLSNAGAPTVASLTITNDATAWWGNMQAIGNTLYTTHYEWVEQPDPTAPYGTVEWTRYYLDEVDLSDRAHPKVKQSINVPGTLVGASSEDPSVLYFADYNWSGNDENDAIAACKVDGGKCYLQSYTPLDGYVGNVIVQKDKAYMTVQEYDWMWQAGTGGVYQQPYVELHQLDLGNPQAPVDRVATNPDQGWGWLLGVQGDRAIVTSGWGPVAVDIYQLSDTKAPAFEETVRTLGWGGANSITRQDNTLYLASGYWGVQPVQLQ
ncbi:MAG: beta-propeller domain-containing protein, partial [Polyangiaceae bacterium]